MNDTRTNLKGSLRRFKRYPAYKDSGVAWLLEIPAHWRLLAFRRLIQRIEQGWSPVAENRPATQDDWGVIKLSAVNTGIFLPSEHKALPADVVPDTRYEIREGDFLLTRANTPELVGDVCVVREVRPKLMLCDLVYRLQIRPEQVCRTFLSYWLTSRVGRYQIQVDAHGSSQSMVKVSQGHIRAWTLLLPPVDEQLVIAEFLDRETATIAALVSKQNHLIELLQQRRTTLINRAVTGSLDPSGLLTNTENALCPRIPDGWVLRKLRRLITQVRRPVMVEPDERYQEIGIRSWGKGIFHKEPLKGAQLEDKGIFYIEPDDLVLNIVFAWEGAVAVASKNEEGMVASHRFPTFRHNPHHVDLDYLLMFLQSDHGRQLMALNSPGAAGRNRTIRLGSFLDEVIPLPPVHEQQMIVARFRDDERRLVAVDVKAREFLKKLHELRTALITAAVTGKIDVRDEAA